MNNPPIHQAARLGDLPTVIQLLDSGTPIDLQDHHGQTPLEWAVLEGHAELAVALVDRGADLQAGGVLGMAACRLPDLVPLLLARGANVNPKSRNKVSPLMMAAAAAETATVTLLLDAGAQINAIDFHKRTALFFAADSAKAENARLLIARGIDVTARNRRGNSALHAAKKAARSILGQHFNYDEVIAVLTNAGVPK